MTLLTLLKATTGGGGVAVSYRSSSTSGTTDAQGTSRTVPVPSGAAAGDIVIIALEMWQNSGDPVVTYPAGFTEIVDIALTGSGPQKLNAAWKRLTGSDAGNYSMSWTGTQWNQAQAICVTGALASGDPIDFVNTATSASGTSVPSTSGTATGADFLVHLVANENSATKTAPTNFTEVQDANYLETNYRILTGSGSTTASGGTLSTSTLSLAALIAIKPDAGGQTATVNQSSETDTATVVGERKLKAIAQANSTETAVAVTRRKTKLLGQAQDVNSATTMTIVTGHIVGQASDANTATTLAERKSKALLQASSTDTATAQTEAKRKTITQSSETDTAAPLTEAKRKSLSQASGADTSTAVIERKLKAIAAASEVDTARDIVRPGQVDRAVETDSVRPLAERKTKVLAQANETSTAGVLTRRKTYLIATASETTSATAVSEIKRKGVSQAIETNTGLAVVARKAKILGQALGIDTARAFSGGGQIFPLDQATEIDTARAVLPQRTTPRPNTGTTSRPGTGTTPRPFAGVTVRP